MTDPASQGHGRWAGLAVLSVSVLVVVMDMTVLNVALPAITADLRPDAVQVLWIVDVYALVLAGLLVTLGALGDRWGRRRLLLSGFAVFGTASAAVLAAGGPEAVIAVRALLGVGGAMIMPSTLSMIRHLFPDSRERATALGVWTAMAAVGGALGPVLGGLLVELLSWRAAFLVNVPVMAVAVVAGLFLLPESRDPAPGRWDLPGAVLSIAGMVALVYAVKHAGAGGGALDGVTLSAGVFAVAALGWFVARCLRRPDPLLEVRLFRSGAFSAGVVAVLAASVAMTGTLLLLAQWLQLVREYSPLESGVRLLPAALAALVAAPLAPWLAARVGARAVLAGGLAVSGTGFLVVCGAPEPLGYPAVAAALALIGFGQGALAIASAVVMAGSPPEKSGGAAAIGETSYEVGGVLGVAVLGSVAAAVYRGELPRQAGAAARESLGGALDVARELGAAGARLAGQATAAFTASLAVTCVAGAALMLAAAVAAWLLTPAGLDLSRKQQ
ncbi:MFS transporter [Nonomuraea sp. RK-328]|nr:MFS transporter [Nonomuraea sp. RK-328]